MADGRTRLDRAPGFLVHVSILARPWRTGAPVQSGRESSKPMFQSSPVHGGRAHVCFKKAVFSAPYSMYFANPAKRAPKSNPLHYSICSNYLKFKHRESPLIFQMLMVRAALGPAPLSALYHKRFFIKQHSLGRTVFLHATVPRFGQAV